MQISEQIQIFVLPFSDMLLFYRSSFSPYMPEVYELSVSIDGENHDVSAWWDDDNSLVVWLHCKLRCDLLLSFVLTWTQCFI